MCRRTSALPLVSRDESVRSLSGSTACSYGPDAPRRAHGHAHRRTVSRSRGVTMSTRNHRTDRRPPRARRRAVREAGGAVLALALSLGVAACAQPSTASPDDDKHVRILFATNADFAIPVIEEKLEAKGYDVDATTITDFQAASDAIENGDA